MLTYLYERLCSLQAHKESITMQIMACEPMKGLNLNGTISLLQAAKDSIIFELNSDGTLVIINTKTSTISVNVAEGEYRIAHISLTYVGGLVLERYDVTPEEDPAYA